MFLIDIDGVLKLGRTPIQSGVEGLKLLEEKKIPYVLVSNGTGSEALSASILSKVLGLSVGVDKLVLSSTPLKQMLLARPDLRVLAIGCRQHYEVFFSDLKNRVVTPEQVIRRYPRIAPQLIYVGSERYRVEETVEPAEIDEIDAIVYFSDSVDYYADIQTTVDVYLNNGSLDPSVRLNRPKPLVVLTNPDIVYADDSLVPKMTIGAEFECFCTLAEKIGGERVQNVVKLGKPSKDVFLCAVEMLKTQQNYDAQKKVFMIGDSLKSDISGANGAGIASVLVMTGMTKSPADYQDVPDSMKPQFVCSDLLEAVYTFM